VLSGRGLCDEFITRPEVSYRVWCARVWSWNLENEEALAHQRLLRRGEKCIIIINCVWVVSRSQYYNKITVVFSKNYTGY